MNAAPPTSFRRGITYAACAWAVVFGAPHLWWALGVRAGFPGGDANYDLFMGSAWRYVFDVIVVVLSVVAVLISLELLKPPETIARRWIPYSLAWTATVLLLIRGIAGLIVDGLVEPFWTLSFVLGGILIGGVAWMARLQRARTTA